MSDTVTTTRKDWVSNQEVRWCPGCGDYGILMAVQMAMTEIGNKPDETVFISGIGCAARFPYYMNTYGIHSIHAGRRRSPVDWRSPVPTWMCGWWAATATCCRSVEIT